MNKIIRITLKKGQIVKVGGIPLQLDEDTSVLTTEENKNVLCETNE